MSGSEYFRQAVSPAGRIVLRYLYKLAKSIADVKVKRKVKLTLISCRRFLHPPGGRQFELVTLNNGLRLWVNLCEDIGGCFYYDSSFEPFEQSIVEQIVKPGDIVFDVGANIGLYSVITSPLVGEHGQVHLFEPIEFLQEIILRSITCNNLRNVTANRLAVGECAGEVDLFVNADSAYSSLGNTGRGVIVCKDRVRCISLDEYAESSAILKVDFLKIDVEGFEGHVLRGAKRLLERSREISILCELDQGNFSPLGFSVDSVFEWMRAQGFEVWALNGKLKTLSLQEGSSCQHGKVYNYLFVRSGVVSQRLREQKIAFCSTGGVR